MKHFSSYIAAAGILGIALAVTPAVAASSVVLKGKTDSDLVYAVAFHNGTTLDDTMALKIKQSAEGMNNTCDQSFSIKLTKTDPYEGLPTWAGVGE